MTPSPYPDEVKDKALALSAAIGMRAASRQLAIPRETIKAWANHPQWAARWHELRRTDAPKWRERAAIPLEDLVDEYSTMLAKSIRVATDALESGDFEPRDLPNLIRSIAVAQGVASDHVGKLRGQPTQITEHRHSAAQLEAGMRKLLEQATIDGTAEEVDDAPPQLDSPESPPAPPVPEVAEADGRTPRPPEGPQPGRDAPGPGADR